MSAARDAHSPRRRWRRDWILSRPASLEANDVVVEKEHAESQGGPAGIANAAGNGFIGENEWIFFGNVECCHFIGKIADGNAERIVGLKPPGIDSHRAARGAVCAEGNPGH